MEKFDNSIQCSDSWLDVSAQGITEYWTCEGDLLLNWKDQGYKTLFDLLTRRHLDTSKGNPLKDKIKFLSEVTNIDYTNNDEIIVRTIDGEKYSATNVIFTCSLGVLKSQHTTLFVPSLPKKNELSIKGLGFGSVNKIFLKFPHRWWPEDSAGFGLIWRKEDKEEFIKSNLKENHWVTDVFQFFTVDYQPRVLCGWITGESSRYIETLSDTQIKDGLCDLLDRFLGKNFNIPQPDKILRSIWYTDKHFRGCYSYRSVDTERLNVSARDLASPILGKCGKPIILFAGEATHDHYYSTVHGAVETGYREADRLINYYRDSMVMQSDMGKQMKIRGNIKEKNCEVDKTSLVIIGAGIAGLAAAKALEDENFDDYIILEAQNYIGGRIRSIPWNNNWIEEGAQFLHGDKSEFAKWCRQNKLLSDIESCEGEGIYVRDDGLRMEKHLIREVDDLVRDTLEECEKYVNINDAECEIPDSIGTIIQKLIVQSINSKNETSIMKKMKEELLDWNIRFLLIDNSCSSLDNLSAKYWGKFQFVGGSEHLIFKNGYNSAVELIAESLNRKNIRLNSSVKTIQWQNANDSLQKSIILTLADNKKIFTDCIIVTCSLGYLKNYHRTMFQPQLPLNHSIAIDNLGFGLINKIYLDFGEPWWESGVKGFQLIWRKNNENDFINTKLASWTKDLTGFDVLNNHKAVLLGWVGGKGAHVIETLSEQEVGDDCINLLRHFLKNNNLPPPKKCNRSQWNKNDYVCGSYSHILTNCESNGVSPAHLAEPIWGKTLQNGQEKRVPVIMLAGEATHDHYYSTTHGAFDSGIKQAINFLRYHMY
ncbi:hypothetical protein PV325_006130 [Microctonus aethiopoides]|nr:hypothetical protein PV325_006130 [Microctonus aethiopoides]